MYNLFSGSPELVFELCLELGWGGTGVFANIIWDKRRNVFQHSCARVICSKFFVLQGPCCGNLERIWRTRGSHFLVCIHSPVCPGPSVLHFHGSRWSNSSCILVHVYNPTYAL